MVVVYLQPDKVIFMQIILYQIIYLYFLNLDVSGVSNLNEILVNNIISSSLNVNNLC